MPTPTYRSRVTSLVWLTPDTVQFAVTKPEGFVFKAGQFILFQVPAAGNSADLQPRAYSIASSPDEADLLFVVKIKEGGRAGRWLREDVREESEVTLLGPLGNFVMKDERDCLFLCTGTGIAPFRSLVHDALFRRDQRRIDLLFGVRHEADIFWRKEMEEIMAHHPNFRFHLALTQPIDTWQGLTGRVHTVAHTATPAISERSVYVCGSPAMVQDVKAAALNIWGVPKERMHCEGFV